MTPMIFDVWKCRAKQLKMETYAIYLAYKDPGVPWYAKVVIACIVGYAFSPINLIPGSMPILAYLGDLIFIAIGIALVVEMVSPSILADCRKKAYSITAQKSPANRVVSSIIVVIWFVFASMAILFTIRVIKDWNVVLEWWFRSFMQLTKLGKNMHPHFGVQKEPLIRKSPIAPFCHRLFRFSSFL